MTVSPEQATEDLVTLETEPVEEESLVPAQASQLNLTASGLNQMCVTPSSRSYVEVSLNDPSLSLQRHHDQLVTGSVMRTYYNIDATGAEVEGSWNRPPQETLEPQPNTTPAEDDVELSGRDQYEYPAAATGTGIMSLGIYRYICSYKNEPSGMCTYQLQRVM